MAHLKTLRLGGWDVNYSSPAIGQLPQLEALDVSATTLTSFPAVLSDLSNLQRLEINEAQAEALVPSSVNHLILGEWLNEVLHLSKRVHIAIWKKDSWSDMIHFTYVERD